MLAFKVYYPIKFQIFNELLRKRTMRNIKHGAFYEISYLPKPLTVSSETLTLNL